MTDQELRDLIARTSVSVDKTLRAIEAMGVRVDDTTKTIKEMSINVADTTKTLKNLGLNVDGINKTTGEIAQEFFFSSLAKHPQLGGINFDFIDSNVRRRSKGQEHEMDIFLENGDTVGIVEVKNKVRKESLEQLKKIVDNFYQFHPKLKDMKIIPAIAGKVFPKDLQESALNQGFIVLTQQGNHIEQRWSS